MASLGGSRVERKEDKKLLTGRGKYTADVNFVNQTYAYFVRSPHARAQIKKVDTSKLSKLGWTAKTNLDEGLKTTLECYKNEINANILRSN